jgi:hypothetical protein
VLLLLPPLLLQELPLLVSPQLQAGEQGLNLQP